MNWRMVFFSFCLAAASCSSGGSEVAQPATTFDRSSETTLVSDPIVEESTTTTTAVEETEPETIAWTACGSVECGVLDVPLDHEDPEGESIELALTRVPSTSDDPIGTLFVNYGGPGAEARDFIEADAEFFTDFVGEHFHVVGWDPRGTGDSQQLACSPNAPELDFPLVDLSDGIDAEFEIADTYFDFIENCGVEAGELANNLSTTDAARDLDLLRQAVGDDELNYLGYSYGTQIGWVYATLFPANTRALVLDGAVPPGAFEPEGIEAWFAAAERALANFDTVCAREATCLAREEGLLNRIDRVTAKLETTPIELADGSSYGADDFLNGIFNVLYLEPVDTGADLDRWIVETDEGDPSGLIEFSEFGADSSTSGLFEAVVCADGQQGTSADYEEYVAGLVEASPRFGRVPLVFLCDRWPGDLDPLPELDTTGAAPMLVVTNTLDPATPFEDAIELAGLLDRAELLVYVGGGHTIVGFDQCVNGVVFDYLVDLTLVEGGLECRGWSALVGALVEPDDSGAIVVTELNEPGAAEAAGLLVGDVIVSVDGNPVTAAIEVGPFERDVPVVFAIERDGVSLEITVVPRGTEWS